MNVESIVRKVMDVGQRNGSVIWEVQVVWLKLDKDVKRSFCQNNRRIELRDRWRKVQTSFC